MGARPVRRLPPLHTLLFVTVLVLANAPGPAMASNGSVAVAGRVEGISVDGDFADWPEGLTEYPIARAEYGVPPVGTDDYHGSFRVGYSHEGQCLFIAVEVRDQDIVAATAREVDDWMASDGCEVYIEGLDQFQTIDQYSIRGQVRARVGQSPAGTLPPTAWDDRVRVASATDAHTHRYEWRLPLPPSVAEAPPSGGLPHFGFDVVVCDRDPDGSFSWMAWGRQSNKFTAARLGLVALASEPRFGVVEGAVLWEDAAEGRDLGRVCLAAADDTSLIWALDTDGAGRYRGEVLPGDYLLAAGYRRHTTDTLRVTVQADRTTGVDALRFARPPLGVRVPAGPGETVSVPALHTVPAGPGFRRQAFRTFTQVDGLPNCDIMALHQDREGVLWLGTEGGGVVRYDGASYAVMTMEHGLPGNYVRAFAEEADGGLWIVLVRAGAWAESGVCRYDGTHLTRLDAADGMPAALVWDVVVDQDGAVWFATGAGATRYDGETLTNYTDEDGLVPGALISAAVDCRGRVWFGSDGSGVSRFDGQRFTTFDGGDGLPAGPVLRIGEDRNGHLWFCCLGGGAAMYDGESFTVYAVDQGLPQAYCTVEDRDGHLWFGTSGEEAYRLEDEAFVRVGAPQGLPSAEVYEALVDADGNLWFGTAAGLSRYCGDQLEVFTDADFPGAGSVSAMAEDREERLWLASDSGLVLYDGSAFTTYTAQEGLPDDAVEAVLVDRDGVLWAGTHGGLARYDGKRFISFTKQDGLAGDEISALLQDAGGVLWVASWGEGLARYDGRRFEVAETNQAFPPRHVHTMLAGTDGDVWIGSYRGTPGLTRYDGRSFAAALPPWDDFRAWVRCLAQDASGTLWLGSFGVGIGRYRNGDVRYWGSPEGVTSNWILDLISDDRGRLWAGTLGGGVTLYDGNVFQSFMARDGLPDNNVQALFQDHSGAVWMATSGGLCRYRPQDRAPAVAITDVVTDRRNGPVSEVALRSLQDRLVLEYRIKGLSAVPGRTVYLRRLVGLHDDWRSTREERAEYQDLPVGEYEFEVRAVDQELNYSEPARVKIQVYHQPLSSSVQLLDLHVQDVFASFYKTYTERSIGSVVVANDDADSVEVVVSLYIPDLMRRPTEQKIALPPHSSQRVALRAALDESILALEGTTPGEAEVSLSCEVGEQMISVTDKQSITIHGRGALTWDALARAAAFVTPEDHGVAEFTRTLYETFRPRLRRRKVDGTIPTAMLLFEALGTHGIKYAADSSTPYAQARGDRSAVDHIQYPAELLQSGMGDCDDCTVLFCSLLENLNVSTALVEAPGHVFMVFDSGVTVDRDLGFGLDRRWYVERDGRFWIPVEVTKLGEGSFMDAWDVGAKTCARLAEAGALRITDVREAWGDYPYGLPPGPKSVEPPQSGEVELAFLADLEAFQRLRDGRLQREFIRPLLSNPDDHELRLRLGRALIESEDYNGGISALTPLVRTELRAEALLLIGLAYVGLDNYEAAVQHIGKASEAEPDNWIYSSRLDMVQKAAAAR